MRVSLREITEFLGSQLSIKIGGRSKRGREVNEVADELMAESLTRYAHLDA